MKNYFIGYKQGNGVYIYVAGINRTSISVTLHTEEAMEFYNVDNAINICEYVNERDLMNNYKPIVVFTEVTEITEKQEEVVESDTITNE